jgi:hypothetical protein
MYSTLLKTRCEGLDERKNAESPSWSLNIILRILEGGKDGVLAGKAQKPHPEFSSYLRKITGASIQN